MAESAPGSVSHASFKPPPVEATRLGVTHNKWAGTKSAVAIGGDAVEPYMTDSQRSFVAHPPQPRVAAAAPKGVSTVCFGTDAFVFDGAETDYRRYLVNPGVDALVTER